MELAGGVGGGGLDLKSLSWKGYGYFLEQHIWNGYVVG